MLSFEFKYISNILTCVGAQSPSLEPLQTANSPWIKNDTLNG